MANLAVEGEPETTDYVLVTDAYAEHDETSSRSVEWFDVPVQIVDDVWIGRPEEKLCEALLDACESKGENWEPYRQFGCSYCFYRVAAPAGRGQELHFDVDNELYRCIALSRLVHPTSVGFAYAARLRTWRNGARQIVPIEHMSLNPHAFVIDPNENWLIPSDVPVLRRLIEAVRVAPPAGRLASALWHHEAVSRHYFIDLRWPLLTTCLEALVRIKDERLPSGRYAGSTKVFVDRLLALAKWDPQLAIPEDDLIAMYEQRSLLSHGLAFGSLDPAPKGLYRVEECLARTIIRKALLEPAFRSIFDSDTNLATALPLRP